jgi:hypothetical protein
MKKLLSFFGLLIFLSFSDAPQLSAQIIVKVRPNRPAVVLKRPAKAKSDHTWVDGHWRYDNQSNRYVWAKGHWKQNRNGHNWTAGKWVACTGGHNWTAGRWTPVAVVAKPRRGKKVVVVKKKGHSHKKKGHHHH